MVHEIVWPANACDGCFDVVVAEQFDNAGAESVVEDVILHGEHNIAFTRVLQDQIGIEWFDEAWVNECNRVAEGFQRMW